MTAFLRRIELAAGLILLPAIVAVVAAEVALTIRQRRPAHVVNGHVIAPFPSENEAAVLALRRTGVRAYPFVGPQQFAFRDYPRANEAREVFPLSGISRTPTELCNEADRDILYDSDEHGFNNPFESWTGRHFDVALIGDSFVHGVCVKNEYQLGTLIRREIPGTLNVGVLGAGPLSELAVLREYVSSTKPRIVLWFFYEGNDVEDLTKENNSALARYLEPLYRQNLAEKQSTVDSLLRAYADSVLAAAKTTIPPLGPGVFRLRNVRKAIGMIAANAPHLTAPPEYALLEKIFRLAKLEVNSWGGEILVVYLPDYHRFDRRVLAYSGYVHNNAEIHAHAVAAARHAGIRFIDVAEAFSADPNPRRFWPKPTSHYGPSGYALVARTVLLSIGKMPPG
ncbi:MAG: hypothetical protein ABR582_10660 [Gemmatimonadaceae bacterium]